MSKKLFLVFIIVCCFVGMGTYATDSSNQSVSIKQSLQTLPKGLLQSPAAKQAYGDTFYFYVTSVAFDYYYIVHSGSYYIVTENCNKWVTNSPVIVKATDYYASIQFPDGTRCNIIDVLGC